VISGPEQWAIEQANSLLAESSLLLWVGNSAGLQNSSNSQQYRQFLGQEYQHLLINCYSGFRANAVIALSGVVRAGGLMVMICPRLEDWPSYRDPEWQNRVSFGYLSSFTTSSFIQILTSKLQADANVAWLTPTEFSGSITQIPAAGPLERFAENKLAEQSAAISAIIKVASGHRNRPLVLSADRGRGKSSALGLAAAELINTYEKHIVITAPSPATVERVFHHAQINIQNVKLSKNKLESDTGSLTYCAIDDLLQNEPCADILFIDEAAALPTHFLMQIIDRFSRIVFSTTLHGYEGSGRGFELRVKQYLKQHKPQFKTLQLHQPRRWLCGDYLEALWFDVFFMASLPLPERQISNAKVEYCRMSKQQLIDDLVQTQAIFQLLINAHYQTSPDDLVRLFDSPEQHCFVIKQDQHIVGVALIIEEGGPCLAEINQKIATGARRVKGHLLAQNLAFQYAQAAVCELTQWRVTRIAIAEEWQSQGLGQQLINYIAASAQSSNISMLSSSFGLNVDLLKFWQKAGFTVVNLSQQAEISSGEHSAQLVKPLDLPAEALLLSMQDEFQAELLYQADKSLQRFDTQVLAKLLLACQQNIANDLTSLANIEHFCAGTRPLVNCKRVLRSYFIAQLHATSTLTNTQFHLLVAVLLQNHSNQEISKKYALKGKKEIEENIRTAIGLLITLNNPLLIHQPLNTKPQ
jgi:tRNA(Met) cytidine acetyltransferase